MLRGFQFYHVYKDVSKLCHFQRDVSKLCHAFRHVSKFHNVHRDVSKLYHVFQSSVMSTEMFQSYVFQSSVMSTEMFQSSIMFTKMFQSSVPFMEMFESSIMLTEVFLFTLQTEDALATQGPQLCFLQKAIQHVQHVWQQHTLHIQANMNCNSKLHQLQQYNNNKKHGCYFKNILLWLYMSKSLWRQNNFFHNDQTNPMVISPAMETRLLYCGPCPRNIREVRSQS